MLLQAYSGFIISFIILCLSNRSLAYFIDGPKCLIYEEVTEATTVVIEEFEDVRNITFDNFLLSKTTVKFGQHIRLICDIELPLKTWKARSKELTEGLSEDHKELDIKSVDMSFHNEYITCEAKALINSTTPKETHGTFFTISDLSPPLISDTPNTVAAMVKAIITLSCKIIGGVPMPTISWQIMRTGDHEFRNLTESSEELTIENATFANAGIYRCIAVNAIGQASKTIGVTVEKLPVAIIEEDSDNTFPYGNTTEFSCKIQGYPMPKAVWSDNQGNILISKDSNINWHEKISALQLQAMKKSNKYTCLAENALGKAEAAVNVAVLSPFVVHEHPDETTNINYGKSTIIVCNVTSSFLMTIKWFRIKSNNSIELSEITNNDKYRMLSNSELQIRFMDLDMVGNYTCEASLVSDVNEKVAFNTNVQIDDLASPVLNDATKIIVTEGNWISLFCKIVEGVPRPALSWQVMKHGDLTYTDLSETSEEIEVQNITISEAGKYRCIARNVMGEINKVTEILVRKAPVAVIDEGSAVSVEYGSNHTFTCRVIAYPLPSIEWKSNRNLTISEETVIHEHEKISKMTVRMQTNNIYYCNAENLLGYDKQIINVTVLSPFTVHQIPSDITKVHYAASASLVCNITSSFPMRIKWYHNSSEVHTSDKHTISANETVLYIAPEDLDLVGNYTCEASLVDDDKPRKTFRTYVEIDDLRPPVITNYTGPTITVNEFKDMELYCKAMGYPEPVVTWTAKLPGFSSHRPVGKGESICSTNTGTGQEGTYICTAINVAGHDTRTIEVKVNKFHPFPGTIGRKISRTPSQSSIFFDDIKKRKSDERPIVLQ